AGTGTTGAWRAARSAVVILEAGGPSVSRSAMRHAGSCPIPTALRTPAPCALGDRNDALTLRLGTGRPAGRSRAAKMEEQNERRRVVRGGRARVRPAHRCGRCPGLSTRALSERLPRAYRLAR